MPKKLSCSLSFACLIQYTFQNRVEITSLYDPSWHLQIVQKLLLLLDLHILFIFLIYLKIEQMRSICIFSS